MKREEGIVLEEIKCFLGEKRLGLALLFLTLNHKPMEFPDFSEGTEWRWETSCVALLGNISVNFRRKSTGNHFKLAV